MMLLMRQVRKPVAALVLLATTAMFGPAAVKAEQEGTFTSVAAGNYDYVSLNQGDTRVTGGSIKGVKMIVESDGGPFSEDHSFLLTCSISSKKTDASLDLTAPCNAVEVTDGSEDKLHMRYERRQGDVTVGAQGAGQLYLLGGTGKYDGVTGVCDYKNEYVSDSMTAIVHHCKWSKSSDPKS